LKIAAPVVSKEERFTQLHRLATVAGSRVAAMFPDAVEREDMIQEALLWLLEHPQRVAEGASAEFPVAGSLLGDLMRYLVPLARRERRTRYGWRAVGQSVYAPEQVRELLPSVWTGEGVVHEASEVRPAADPAEGNTWLTMVVDVRWAVEECLTDDEKALLFEHYVLGRDWPTIAQAMGVTESALWSRSARLVSRICDVLNGVVDEDAPRPGTTLGDGPGTRRAVSNAHAREITDGSYYE